MGNPNFRTLSQRHIIFSGTTNQSFMRLFCALIFFGISIVQSQAQFTLGFDVSGGPSILGVKENLGEEGTSFVRYTSPMGVSLGPSADYEINEYIKISSGLRFTTKAISATYTSADSTDYAALDAAWDKKIIFTCSYLRVPLFIQGYYDFLDNPNLIPFVRIGGTADLRLSHCDPGGLGTNPPEGFEYLAPLDVTIVIGGGFQFKTNSGKYMNLHCTFYKGITDNVTAGYEVESSQLQLFNNSLLVGFSYRFK